MAHKVWQIAIKGRGPSEEAERACRREITGCRADLFIIDDPVQSLDEAPKFPVVDIDAVHKSDQAQTTKPYLSREKMDVIEAFDSLKAEIQKDREYAWSWHCNLAMAFQDEGAGHEQANMAASRFMQNCFCVDVTAFNQWISFDWVKEATVKPKLTVHVAVDPGKDPYSLVHFDFVPWGNDKGPLKENY